MPVARDTYWFELRPRWLDEAITVPTEERLVPRGPGPHLHDALTRNCSPIRG